LLDVGGTLYGTTYWGGATDNGTVFSVTPSGAESVIYSFKGGSDGGNPSAGLISVGGTLYGTTYGNPAIGNGTVFSVTPSGTETVLYSFKGGSDGAGPRAGLLEFNGLLYGTTLGGGNGNGTVFNVTLAGTETVVHSFQGGSDGKDPQAALINVHGTLYGTTINGVQGNQDRGGEGGVFVWKFRCQRRVRTVCQPDQSRRHAIRHYRRRRCKQLGNCIRGHTVTDVSAAIDLAAIASTVMSEP